MKRILLFLLLICTLSISAQELQVRSFRQLPENRMDILNDPEYDNEGKLCALIQVEVVPECFFSGSILQRDNHQVIKRKISTYWLYMPTGKGRGLLDELKIESPGYLPLTVHYDDYGITLESGRTYVLTIVTTPAATTELPPTTLSVMPPVMSPTPAPPVATKTANTPDVSKYTANGVSFQMVKVNGGTFTMGATPEQESNASDNDKPAHSVTLSSYYIGKYEVTQELWRAVMGSNPSYYKGNKRPVESVSWNDCQAFISKLNTLTGEQFRLPTEAEWEFAARGGVKSQDYKYSGSNAIDDVAWYYGNSGQTTHDVGTKSPNELGLYDMSGNVCEWCSDWYGKYSSSSQTNPTGHNRGSYRVLRGGCFFSDTKSCRSSIRYGLTPGDSYYYLGLRLVLSQTSVPSPTAITSANTPNAITYMANGDSAQELQVHSFKQQPDNRMDMLSNPEYDHDHQQFTIVTTSAATTAPTQTTTAVTTPVITPTASRSSSLVYIGAAYQVGSLSGLSVDLGADISGFNIEAGMVKGTATEAYYVKSPDGFNLRQGEADAMRFNGKLGYTIPIGNSLRLTPQLGAGLLLVSDDIVADNANALSVLIGVRAAICLGSNFQIVLSPEFAVPVSKSVGYEALSAISGIDAWSNGFNIKAGIAVSF